MRRNPWSVLFSAALICCLSAPPLTAADGTYKLIVTPGDHDRMNVPASVRLVDGDGALKAARSVKLTGPGGREFPAQLTEPGLLGGPAEEGGRVVRQLHFILPEMKQGEKVSLTATVSSDPPAGGFTWKDTPGKHAELSFGDRPVLRYMYQALDDSDAAIRTQTYKVFHHLYDPAGTRFITKGAGGQYTHHRGIFFGFSKTGYGEGKRVDTWHCSGDTHLSHEGFLASEAGPVLGRHLVEVDWHGVGKEVFAKERRELTVYNVRGGQLVEFATELSSTGGKVLLDGDPQHAGFQFRAAQDVAAGDQKLTYYLRPDGKGEPGATRNWPGNKDFVNLPFNAMSFVVEGRRYTAVYLDKPTNPKEARFSERSYGRFGSYFVHEVTEEKPLYLNYRIWLQEGELTGRQAAALSADFVSPVRVEVVR